MATRISCPGCGEDLTVPDSLMGQTVKCSHCQALLRAGATPELLSRPAPATEEATPGTEPPPEPDPVGYEPVHCRFCAEAIPSSAKVCPLCGESLTDAPDLEDQYIRRDVLPHRGNIILILGIFSLVLVVFNVAIGLIPSIGGIILGSIAWSMGQRDLTRIRKGEMDPSGQGTVNAGMICGIIGTIINVLITLLCGGVALFFLGAFLWR